MQPQQSCASLYSPAACNKRERIREFDFAAAVIAWQTGADNVVAELEDHKVPYFLFGLPPTGQAAIGSQPLVVTDVELVLPALVILLSP